MVAGAERTFLVTGLTNLTLNDAATFWLGGNQSSVSGEFDRWAVAEIKCRIHGGVLPPSSAVVLSCSTCNTAANKTTLLNMIFTRLHRCQTRTQAGVTL